MPHLNYSGSEATATVVVKPASSSVTVSPIAEIKDGKTQEITIAVDPEVEGTVKVTVIGDDYTFEQTYDVFELASPIELTGLAVGDYIVEVVFTPAANYESSIADASFTVVPKNATVITIDAPSEITYGDALTVGTELTSNGQVVSGDVVVVVKDAAGNVVSDLSKLDAGQYSINATFAGDEEYAATEATATVVVKQAESDVVVVPIAEIKDGKTQVISVVVDPEVEGTVKVTVIGDDYTFEQTYAVSELASPIELTGLAVGEYNVEVVFTPAANYESSTADASFTVVPKDATVITITAPSEITYGDALTVGTELTSGGELIAGDVVVVVKDAAGNVVLLKKSIWVKLKELLLL